MPTTQPSSAFAANPETGQSSDQSSDQSFNQIWPFWLDDSRLTSDPLDGFDFGDPVGEQRASMAQPVIVPLAHIGVIAVRGAETISFLQGQLSNDLAALTVTRAQINSYNSPKGRVLAVLAASRDEQSICLETESSLLTPLLKRLRMFVMRAKVELADVSAEHPQFGLIGSEAIECLLANGLPAPTNNWELSSAEDIRIQRRPGSLPRFSIQASPRRLAEIWNLLRPSARPAGTAAWRLHDILAGLPSITAATQDHFVAQMLNLDTLGGISFTKGCYTGQEVVARLHYLGNLKRRMHLGLTAATPPVPGSPVYVADGDGQAVGEVVNASRHPQHGSALLAVLQQQHAASTQLRLNEPGGPPLQIVPIATTG